MLGHSAINNFVPGEDFCTFSGINGDFVYIFIPFLCFESFLFILAARVFISNMKRDREISDEKRLRLNTFVGILTRDSLCYFFVCVHDQRCADRDSDRLTFDRLM